MDDEGSRRRSLWPVVAALAVVVAALAATLVVLKAQDPRPRAAVGEVLDHPFQEDPLPHAGQVLLPWARVQVAAGEPRQELPEVLGAPSPLQAPDGGSFVRVDVSLEEDFALPLAAVATPYSQETEVVLRADGRDYPLSGRGGLVLDPGLPGPQGGSRWVAVAGEPSDLEVRVTVDGETQTVDASDGSVDAGRAADLARLPSPDEVRASEGSPCGKPRRLDDSGLSVTYRPSLQCRVQLVLRLPYVDGLGWAEEGREFVVVHVVRPRRVSLTTGPQDRSWDTDLTFTARLGESEPVGPGVGVNELNQGALAFQDPEDPQQFVFDVAQGETGDLTFDLVGQARRGEPFVTERRPVHFRWRVDAGEVG